MKPLNLSEDTKAILLLCCPLAPKSAIRSLTLTEYNRLALVLYERGMRPASLFDEKDLDSLATLAKLADGERLKGLLALRGKLGFIVEEWQQSGIWIVSRADAYYPERIREHLGHQRPPILFGIGDICLLQKGGLGIVGSRNIDQPGEEFTQNIAELCAYEKIPIVSGGARGVDSIAMLSCAQHGGCAVGFLPDSLLTKSLSATFREYIASGAITLLSPYHPKAGFTVGAALGRNKLIYAQSDHVLVINSDFQKGGTWAGSTEELKRTNHRTVFVRTEATVSVGNKEILKLGGIPFPRVSDSGDLKHRLLNASADIVRTKVIHSKKIQGSLLT